MKSLKQKCIQKYKASYHGGTRDVKVIKWIVMHDTEGGTAKGVAEYFSGSKAEGSATLVVDDKDCYRCLADTTIPYGAPGANTNGFHIEQCGYARWSLVIWKRHINTLRRAAYKAALHCHKFNIPPVFVAAKGLKNGQKGITTHAECTKAFGGDHTDPGKLWPRPLFMLLVHRYFKALS